MLQIQPIVFLTVLCFALALFIMFSPFSMFSDNLCTNCVLLAWIAAASCRHTKYNSWFCNQFILLFLQCLMERNPPCQLVSLCRWACFPFPYFLSLGAPSWKKGSTLRWTNWLQSSTNYHFNFCASVRNWTASIAQLPPSTKVSTSITLLCLKYWVASYYIDIFIST